MIELEQLEQLVVFAEEGTLSAAAAKLHISQPTLTRTMQSLENEFRVALFARKKNKLVLNENGVLAVLLIIPILDEDAHVVFYCCCKKEKQETLKDFLQD